MLAVQVVVGSSLTVCLGLARRDYTFDGNTFCLHFIEKFWVWFEFRF